MCDKKEILNVFIRSKEYDDFGLHDVKFKVSEGDVVALLGTNGNGKTTILKCILDIINYDGKIEIFGNEISKKDDSYKELLGVVFDDFCFNESLNINILNKIMSHLYKNWEEETFIKYIDKFELPKNKMFLKFSKGMKAKVSLAVALSHKAKLLIMDEPTSGLDPVFRREFMYILKSYIEKEKAALVFSTHITSDVMNFAERILLVSDGEIILEEKTDVLLSKYVVYRGTADKLKEISRADIYYMYESENQVEALIVNESEYLKEIQEYLFKPTLDDVMVAIYSGKKGFEKCEDI